MKRFLSITLFLIFGLAFLTDDAEARCGRRAARGSCAAAYVSAPVARRAVVRERHVFRTRAVARGGSCGVGGCR